MSDVTLPGTLLLLLKIQSLLLHRVDKESRLREVGNLLEVTQQNTSTGSELVGPLAELLGASTVCDLLQPHTEGNPATGDHLFLEATEIHSNLFLCIWMFFQMFVWEINAFSQRQK